MDRLLLDLAMTRPAAAAGATSEEALVEAARRGDRDAFGALVRAHQGRVFRLASRFYRRREEVEDAAQDTFLTAWRRLSTYRGDAPFEHWLTRVCLNCCYQRLRRRRPGDDGEALDADRLAALPAPAADPDARLEVARLLARLPAKDRFLLVLLDGEGWSVAETADRLGWTRVNVKVRAHRARKRLRRLLEHDLPSRDPGQTRHGSAGAREAAVGSRPSRKPPPRGAAFPGHSETGAGPRPSGRREETP